MGRTKGEPVHGVASVQGGTTGMLDGVIWKLYSKRNFGQHFYLVFLSVSANRASLICFVFSILQPYSLLLSDVHGHIFGCDFVVVATLGMHRNIDQVCCSVGVVHVLWVTTLRDRGKLRIVSQVSYAVDRMRVTYSYSKRARLLKIDRGKQRCRPMCRH
jgi:hypothetical protein